MDYRSKYFITIHITLDTKTKCVYFVRFSTFDDVPTFVVCCAESSKDILMDDYKKDGGQRFSWVTKCQTHGQSLHYI